LIGGCGGNRDFRILSKHLHRHMLHGQTTQGADFHPVRRLLLKAGVASCQRAKQHRKNDHSKYQRKLFRFVHKNSPFLPSNPV
jgi:hypothetical protein